MRILAFARESYPSSFSTSYVLLHQSMALEELGHEVHLFNLGKHPLVLRDYLEAFDFDLIFLDLDFLNSEPLLRTLRQYRRIEAMHVVGALSKLPPPPDDAWEVVDFSVTPWKGETISALGAKFDLRYLPFAYNAKLHRRTNGSPLIGGVFVGNTAGDKSQEAGERLAKLREERVIHCVGPGFEEKYMDPFTLGQAYAASRCLPNFHYSWEKGKNFILNERFWQTARCGIPVNDYSPLMNEVFDNTLAETFCFADKRQWQDRIRRLNSGADVPGTELLQKLDNSMMGHSYHDRMKQLLEWLL
jgi:hypothetical protein